ncbi:MAG: acyltransferase [Bryobacteraceae bacterium]
MADRAKHSGKGTAPGWLGVDLFFVLSGLLITSILLTKRSDAHFLRDFYARRIRRILPLYLIMLAVMVLVFGASWKFVLICLFTGANLLPVFGVASPAPASVFWSLAVEEHFYFLWPITIRHLKRTNLAMICAAVIVVEPSLRYVCAMHGIDTYEYSWFRFDGLAMGAFLAVYLSSRFASPACSKWLVVSCAMVFVAGILFLIMAHAISNAGNKPAGTLRSTIAQFGFSGLMLAALEFPGKWVAPLCSRFARLTANLSYCLYLIHLSVAQIHLVLHAPYICGRGVQGGHRDRCELWAGSIVLSLLGTAATEAQNRKVEKTAASDQCANSGSGDDNPSLLAVRHVARPVTCSFIYRKPEHVS